jgi:8-oxo-dGTP diphosphatase
MLQILLSIFLDNNKNFILPSHINRFYRALFLRKRATFAKKINKFLMVLFDKALYIPYLAIDCVIFGYQKKELKVLVSKLKFKGDFFALPSGFIRLNEDIDEAAYRILEEKTGISNIFLEHFKNFGQANRTNKAVFERIIEQNQAYFSEGILSKEDFAWLSDRFISLGYYALVDIDKATPIKTEFDASIEWYAIHELPNMILDHSDMVAKALESLRLNLDTNIIVLNLLSETFTMKEVQDLYETIFEQTYARNNFQKKILELNVLERLEKKMTGAANKAPYLYKFKK